MELLGKLNLIKSNLVNNDSVPVLKHFCFDKNTITAFNGIQASVVNHNSDIDCAISGQILLQLLDSDNGNKVSIQKSDNNIFLKLGSSRIRLVTLPKDYFIFELPEVEVIMSFDITDDFILGLEKCLTSILPEDFEKDGVTFIVKNTKGTLYSTNNMLLSKYELSDSFKKDFSILLPTFFCMQLIQWYKEFNTCSLQVCKNDVIANFEVGYIYTKLPDVELLDFESVLLDYTIDYSLFTVPKNILDMLKKCLILGSSDILCLVNIDIDENYIDIKSKSSNGVIKDTIELPVNLGKFSFNVIAKDLQDALVSVTDMAIVNFKDSGIIIGHNNSYTNIVLSVDE